MKSRRRENRSDAEGEEAEKVVPRGPATRSHADRGGRRALRAGVEGEENAREDPRVRAAGCARPRDKTAGGGARTEAANLYCMLLTPDSNSCRSPNF